MADFISPCLENAAQLVHHLQNLLANELVRKCLIRLANHAALLKNKTFMDEHELIQRISALDDVTVHVAVDSLEPIVICGSSIYIGSCAANFSIEDVYAQLAELMNKMSGYLLDDVAHHVAAMLAWEPKSMEHSLDDLHITKLDLPTPLPYIFRPKIGSFVPLNWHSLLCQEVLVFKTESLAALELDDPVEERSTTNEDHEVENTTETAVYIIVKVISRVVSGNAKMSDNATGPLTTKYRIDAGEHGRRIVSGIQLYAFRGQAVNFMAGSLCKLMQNSIDHLSSSSAAFNCSTAVDFDSIVEELKNVLNVASQLLEEQDLLRLIKRLYLCWRLEQNVSSGMLCNRVIGSLTQLIQTKKLMPDIDFSYMTNTLDLRCLELRASGLQACVSSTVGEDVVDAASRSLSFYPRTKPNPQPREAHRWMRQAMLDVQAARNDLTSVDHHSPEWACFKCHQAVEKALKAVHYSIDCNRTMTHDLQMLSHALGNAWLHPKVSELSRLCVRSEAMRYPDCHHYPLIPHQVYSGRAEAAIQLASEIVGWVQQELEL